MHARILIAGAHQTATKSAIDWQAAGSTGSARKPQACRLFRRWRRKQRQSGNEISILGFGARKSAARRWPILRLRAMLARLAEPDKVDDIKAEFGCKFPSPASLQLTCSSPLLILALSPRPVGELTVSPWAFNFSPNLARFLGQTLGQDWPKWPHRNGAPLWRRFKTVSRKLWEAIKLAPL